MNGISLIILTKDGAEHLNRLLSSFFQINTYPPVELLIIDHGDSGTDSSQLTNNNSQLTTRNVVSKYISKAFIRHIKRDRNYTFAESCNYGASKARYPYLLFCNNDIIYTSDVLPKAADVLEKNESIGAVGVRLDDVEPLPGSELSVNGEHELPVNSYQLIGSDPPINDLPSETTPKEFPKGFHQGEQITNNRPQAIQHLGVEFKWNEKRGYHQPEQIRHPSLKDFLYGCDQQPDKISADSCKFACPACPVVQLCDSTGVAQPCDGTGVDKNS